MFFSSLFSFKTSRNSLLNCLKTSLAVSLSVLQITTLWVRANNVSKVLLIISPLDTASDTGGSVIILYLPSKVENTVSKLRVFTLNILNSGGVKVIVSPV
ncbi:Uncharacterised protein [Legionella pneumophila]|nr:Uncharacterised protein [Legionella pneumophila]